MSEMRASPKREKTRDRPITADTVKPLGLTEPELCGWLTTAAPGDVLEYHRGFLVLDVRPDSSRLVPADRRTLAQVARRAYWAAERGWVHLVQRRHGPHDYAYLTIARPLLGFSRGVLLAALAEELPE